MSLLRKLAILLKHWRNCPERVCRRQRSCASPRLVCLDRKPARTVSPEKQAVAMAQLQQLLRQELERRGAAGQ